MNKQFAGEKDTGMTRVEARFIKQDYDASVRDRDAAIELRKQGTDILEGYNQSIGFLKFAAHTEAAQDLEKWSENFKEHVNEHGEVVDRKEMARKATLTDSREHLQQNREAYEQAAIEDANAAGHDVNFGGEQYPAQAPDQPKE